MLADTGFVAVRVEQRADGDAVVDGWGSEYDAGAFVVSGQIAARAPDS